MLSTSWLLLLLPIGLRLLLPRAKPVVAWESRIDLPLALLCGAVMGPLAAFWLTQFHLQGSPVYGADFQQYCLLVDHIRRGHMPSMHYERVMGAAILPALFAKHYGIMDGLSLSAIVSVGITASSLYLWGRALHSRLAGVTAACLLGASAPLVIVTHSLSFYSIWTAAFTFGAATAALALRYRRMPALFFAGLGVGVILAVDVRGLVWAMPLFGLTVMACLLAPWKWWIPRLGMAALPLVLSYHVSHQLTLPNTPPLEVQIRRFEEDAKRNSGLPFRAIGEVPFQQERFLWGHSSPLAVVNTLKALVMLANETSVTADTEETRRSRERYVTPWIAPLGVGLFIGSVGLIRQPWLLFAFWGSLLPFLASFWRSMTIWPHMRMLSTVSPGIPLVLGVAFAMLLLGPSLEVDPPPLVGHPDESSRGFWLRWLRWRPLLTPIVSSVIVLLVVLGVVPSYLSVEAPWRARYLGGGTLGQTMQYLGQDLRRIPREFNECVDALYRDQAAGLPVPGKVYPWNGKPPR